MSLLPGTIYSTECGCDWVGLEKKFLSSSFIYIKPYPFQLSVTFHIETSQLICSVNQ